MYTGLTQKTGICAICKKKFPKGTLVYFDATKSDGNNLAHKVCYDELRAERGVAMLKKSTSKVKSKVDLDPPF